MNTTTGDNHPLPLAQWPDEALVAACQQGALSPYFGVLFERYRLVIYAKCLELTANPDESQDLTQATFQKAAVHLQNQTQVAFFVSWLLTICRNTCLDYLKSRASASKNHNKWLNWANSTDEFMENEAFRRLIYEEEDKKYNFLYTGIAQLPPEQRTCLTLFCDEHLSYRQISERTGWPITAVKSHLQNGRRTLKRYLLEHGFSQ